MRDEYIAYDIINGKITTMEQGFNNYSFIYRNSNENIYGYLKQLPIKDKDVLTVASSGDHATISDYLGAKSIDTFDISVFTKYYQELKIGAYKNLDYDDFIKFFFTEKGFCYEIFEKIISLSIETDDFWQFLFDFNDDYKIIDSPLFSNSEVEFAYAHAHNPLLNKSIFKSFKPSKKINFYQCDVLQLPFKLKKTYDVIMLSSIPNFIKEFNNLQVFKNYLKLLSQKLNKNGYIICDYLYNIDKDILFSDNDFKNFVSNMQFITFPSIDDVHEDGVLIYKK